MDEATLAEVVRHGAEVDVPAGTVLTRQGEPGDEFFVLLTGSAAVEVDGSPVGVLGPGDFLGEIALLTRSRRTATVTTTAPARLLVLPGRAFHELTDRIPTLAAHAWAATAARL